MFVLRSALPTSGVEAWIGVDNNPRSTGRPIIWAAVVAVLDHRELRDGQPVVQSVLRIHQPDCITTNRAILGAVFHRHAFDHGAVQAAVFLDQRGAFHRQQLAQRILASVFGDLRVQLGNGCAQPSCKDCVGIGVPLGRAAIGARNRVVEAAIAQSLEVIEQDSFDFGFGQCGHARIGLVTCANVAKTRSTSAMLRNAKHTRSAFPSCIMSSSAECRPYCFSPVLLTV